MSHGDDGTDIMISYNHYASGAVGDFLYRRTAVLRKFSRATGASGSSRFPAGT